MPVQHPTFLMLDVKGSTKVAQALSRQDYVNRVHKRLYDTLEELFARYGGTMSGTPKGDDATVVFENVNQALECAVAIQQKLPAAMKDDPDEQVRQLKVRIAVHRAVKETYPLPDGLYSNDTEIIFPARLLQYVEGGQIIASEETFARSDNKRWTWAHWGNRLIEKWDDTPQTLHELVYDGWTSTEPGIRFRPEWFRETNQYIPRPALEQQIAALFARKTVNGTPYRLVTLHDIGGMGKTRLAVQVCLNSVGLFQGRLVFVRLDGISEDLLRSEESRRNYLAGQIATAFGVEDKDAAPDKLPAKLKENKKIDRPTLLLLDNYETVQGEKSAEFVGDVLDYCPLLTILVTGREPVGLQDDELDFKEISFQEDEAHRLFVTRVQEKKVNFEWQPDENERQALASILEDTACIPLAVELVAAHAKFDSLPEIAANLHQEMYGVRTALPVGMYTRKAADRHKTLEKCFDWSWKLLSEPARQALMRLSLFADNALETEVRGCFPEIEGKALVQLQNAALLLRSEDNHQNQYTLLNPTRQYGRKRLKTIDREEKFQRYYVAYYRQIVEENGYPDKLEISEHLERLKAAWQHAIRAAEHAAERQDAESCGKIADRLVHFVVRQALQRDAISLYELVLAVRRRISPVVLLDIALGLNNLAALYHLQGRYEEAELLLIEALEIRQRELPEGHPDIAQSFDNLAQLHKILGHYVEAEPLMIEALRISQGALPEGHPDIARSLNILAALYGSQGHYDKAEPLYDEALQIFERALGPEHPNTKIVRGNLEILQQKRNK